MKHIRGIFSWTYSLFDSLMSLDNIPGIPEIFFRIINPWYFPWVFFKSSSRVLSRNNSSNVYWNFVKDSPRKPSTKILKKNLHGFFQKFIMRLLQMIKNSKFVHKFPQVLLHSSKDFLLVLWKIVSEIFAFLRNFTKKFPLTSPG